MSDIASLTRQLHHEATDLIHQTALREALSEVGDATIGGSYTLGLLTWRDLDCHVLLPGLDLGRCFTLGRTLAERLRPRRMNFRDERPGDEPTLPIGLYWGLHDVPGSQGTWKVDVWLVEQREFDRINHYHRDLQQRLDDNSRATILRLKSECCAHPLYRREFFSTDIYAAVLDHGVTSMPTFRHHLQQTRNLSI